MPPKDPAPKNRAAWNDKSDAYQAAHDGQLSANPLAWGVWGIPEAELAALGDFAGQDVLEFGCGGGQWSIALAQQGVRVAAMDLSERQLAHAKRFMDKAGVRVPLVHANGESTPFADASFDLVFCDHGAMTFARPQCTVAEAARILRPGGRFVFNIASPFLYVCWDAKTDTVSERLEGEYFGMNQFDEDGEVSHQLPYGEWIRLFRSHSFVVEDLIEIRPPADATTSYEDYVSLEWARRWPAESLWKLSKASAGPS